MQFALRSLMINRFGVAYFALMLATISLTGPAIGQELTIDTWKITIDQNPSDDFVEAALEDLEAQFSYTPDPNALIGCCLVGNYGMIATDHDLVSDVFHIIEPTEWTDIVFREFSYIWDWQVPFDTGGGPIRVLFVGFRILNDDIPELETIARDLWADEELVDRNGEPIGIGVYPMYVGPFAPIMSPSAVWAVHLTATPEPTSFVLVISGLSVLIMAARHGNLRASNVW
jgi:hypothetical protein